MNKRVLLPFYHSKSPEPFLWIEYLSNLRIMLIGIFVFLTGLVKMGMNWEALENFESRLISSLRSNLKAIAGVLSMIGIATLIGVILGGTGSDIWLHWTVDLRVHFPPVRGGWTQKSHLPLEFFIRPPQAQPPSRENPNRNVNKSPLKGF